MWTRPAIIWNILCIVVAASTCAGIAIKTLSHATDVAEPITITATGNQADTVTVSRMSRGGVEYPLTNNSHTWTTSEWTRAINIQTNTKTQITVTIGSQVTNIALDPTLENTTLWTLDAARLTHHTSHLSYFSNLINWPGDAQAMVRSVKSGLPLGFAIWVVLMLFGFLVPKLETVAAEPVVTTATVRLVQFLCLCMLIAFAWFNFASNNPTAYEWPSLDMAPYLLRHSDPTLLANDFYTSASLLPSPRHIFGNFILGLASLLDTDWYSVFFILKCILVLATPCCIFLCLISIARKHLTPLREITFSIVTTVGILLCLIPEYVSVFSYALWYPYQTTVTPQTLALCLALLGITAQNNAYKKTGLFLWGFATLFHPTVAICTLVFYSVLDYTKWKQQVLTVLTIIVPCSILLQSFFTSSNPISAADFVFHYITSNHWFHYLPSQFAANALSPFPWYIHFTLILTLLGLLGYSAARKKDRNLAISVALALGGLIGSVVICYVAIEYYPIKTVAMLGPSRLAQFAYWFILYLFALDISRTQYLTAITTLLVKRLKGTVHKRHYVVLTVCCLLLICGGHLKLQDNPFAEWQQRELTLANWIITTPKESTFATNLFDLSVNIPIVMHRATFASTGFPFNSDTFSEFNKRKFLLFGSPNDWKHLAGATNHIKMDTYYRSRTVSDWCHTAQAFPLDYIIIEPAFNQAFTGQTPVFANESYLIYETETLCSTLTS